jgi:hypothetical protein
MMVVLRREVYLDEKRERRTPMVETILVVLLVLAIGAVPPFLWVVLLTKRSKMISRPGMNAVTRGARYRDGGVTYSQYRGVRYNIVPENPNEQHNARYELRHHSKQHKQKKPWMK